MVVNCHTAISSTTNRVVMSPGASAACTVRTTVPEAFFHTHNILGHLIWGGILERHPSIKFVFTEQGSGWVVRELETMDYSYSGSYFRTDYHDEIRSKPSEYFERQCYLGSSILARVEVGARHQIGIDKMMIGMDMPHHEGMLIHGVREYLRATLGAESVPLDEARLLLGHNAARVFGFDLDRLAPVAERIGLQPDEVLSPPERDLYPLGDVHKPSVQLL
jgi:predicted TIM-barrel fold metal-dependent hydrolase